MKPKIVRITRPGVYAVRIYAVRTGRFISVSIRRRTGGVSTSITPNQAKRLRDALDSAIRSSGRNVMVVEY